MQDIDYKIFTIGHGNKKIEEFINLLTGNDIEVVMDVRSYPYSRFHPQYRKKELEQSLKQANIGYIFLGDELGGRPKNPEMYINGEVSYQAIKKSKPFNLGIKRILDISKEIKVTLMCSEADQNQCHRKHLIADELVKFGVKIFHINRAGIIEVHYTESKLFV